MRRREFISLVGGAAVWPLAAGAQQPGDMRRIGVLMNIASDDPEALGRITAFVQGLQQLGWTDGRNVRIDVRWGQDDVALEHKYAAELVQLSPNIILASGTMSVGAVQSITHALPIVFVGVTDPAGAGFVETLARPHGNT